MGKQEFSNCEKEIKNLIQSFHPIIYIVSHEEIRVLESLGRISNNLEQYLIVWSETKGFAEYSPEDTEETYYPHMNIIKGQRQPHIVLGALEGLPANKSNEAVIFVMRDFHPYLDKEVMVRWLRDINNDFRSNYKTLILLSPILKLPKELEKDVSVVYYDVPTKRDVVKIIWNSFKNNVDDDKQEVLENIDKNYLEALTRSAMGLTHDEIENVIAHCLIKYRDINSINVKDVFKTKGECINRTTESFRYIDGNIGLDDIIGIEDLKRWIVDKKKWFEISAKKYGVGIPKGIAIFGPGNVGKSMVVQAMGSTWKLPIVKLNVMDFDIRKLRKDIGVLLSLAPFILWVDFEGGDEMGIVDYIMKCVKEEQTGISNPYNIFLAVTSNNKPNPILDYNFNIDLPNDFEREALVKFKLKNTNRDYNDKKKFNLREIVEATKGLTGKQIFELIDRALNEVYSSISDDAKEVRDINTKDICMLTTGGLDIYAASSNNECKLVENDKNEDETKDSDDKIKIDNRKKKLPLNKPKVDAEEEQTIGTRLKTVKVHSEMLDPHINEVNNLEVPGEIEIPRVTNFKDDPYFDEEKIKMLKNQFQRYI